MTFFFPPLLFISFLFVKKVLGRVHISLTIVHCTHKRVTRPLKIVNSAAIHHTVAYTDAIYTYNNRVIYDLREYVLR